MKLWWSVVAAWCTFSRCPRVVWCFLTLKQSSAWWTWCEACAVRWCYWKHDRIISLWQFSPAPSLIGQSRCAFEAVLICNQNGCKLSFLRSLFACLFFIFILLCFLSFFLSSLSFFFFFLSFPLPLTRPTRSACMRRTQHTHRCYLYLSIVLM